MDLVKFSDVRGGLGNIFIKFDGNFKNFKKILDNSNHMEYDTFVFINLRKETEAWAAVRI